MQRRKFLKLLGAVPVVGTLFTELPESIELAPESKPKPKVQPPLGEVYAADFTQRRIGGLTLLRNLERKVIFPFAHGGPYADDGDTLRIKLRLVKPKELSAAKTCNMLELWGLDPDDLITSMPYVPGMELEFNIGPYFVLPWNVKDYKLSVEPNL